MSSFFNNAPLTGRFSVSAIDLVYQRRFKRWNWARKTLFGRIDGKANQMLHEIFPSHIFNWPFQFQSPRKEKLIHFLKPQDEIKGHGFLANSNQTPLQRLIWSDFFVIYSINILIKHGEWDQSNESSCNGFSIWIVSLWYIL